MPPATITRASPRRISRRANITACRPEPQTLFTVIAPVETGRSALITHWRAGAWPMPAESTLPMITRSTCSGRAPARFTASRTTTAPRSEAESPEKAPWNPPIGVRAALAITTSGWLMKPPGWSSAWVPAGAPRVAAGARRRGQDGATVHDPRRQSQTVSADSRSRVPEGFQAVRAPAPAGLEPGEELQVDPRAEQSLEPEPGLRADPLDRRAPGPDRDPPLARALEDQLGPDADQVRARLVPLHHLDGQRVGDLLLERLEGRLAHELGGEEAERPVAELIGRVEGRRHGEARRDRVEELRDPGAAPGRDAQAGGGRRRAGRGPRGGGGGRPVDLRRDEQHRLPARGEPGLERRELRAEAGRRVGEEQRDVAGVGGLLHLAIQRGVEPAAP